MGRLKLGLSVRKNIVIDKDLFEKSFHISEELNLTYTEYIRRLIFADIKSRENPPEVSDIPIAPLKPRDENNITYIGMKKRMQLIKIMHELRRALIS